MSIPNLPPDIRSAETPRDLSQWHSNREVLYNLYIHHRRTLNDVKKIMESNYGFPTTLKHNDYEVVLREVFKFRKYLNGDDLRQSIGPEIARRKAAGKRSVVLLNGSKVENVERKIQRSSKHRSSRRCAKAHTATLPYGVAIRSPSPQPPALVSSPAFGRDPMVVDIERNERGQTSMVLLADYRAELDWLDPLMDVIPLPVAGSGLRPLSAQFLRESCPINELLTLLNEYERRFNHVDLRLFGPNATIGILGKICFDFSNNLQHKSISRNEMTSILDWIGYRADKTSLKTFFGQKASTILAAWEALLSTILSREHSAALDVILFIHSSLKDQAPLVTGKWGHGLSNYLRSAPDRAAALINAYPWDQHELDKALRDALSFRFCPPRSWPCVGKYWIFDPDLVQPLVGAGASLKNEDRRFSVDHLVCNFGRPQYQAADVDLLKSLLEAGAVVDEPPDLSRDWAEMSSPIHATDYLLLDGGNSTHNHHLWSLISSYSDRQQTTVTVPGIFEAAQGGHEQLRDYLSARSKPHNSDVRSRILEISLSEASGRGHANVVQSLVQFGIDPNVPTLPRKSTNRRLGIWHPIIRAANNGNVDTLRILVTASTNDIASRWYPYEVEELDILAWRDMERSQLHQTLRLLSTLNLATATRNEILLHALSPHNFGRDYDDIDFGLVNQLLDLGLAALDLRAYADEGTHPLVRAMRKGCGSRALNYLVELDIGVISGLFDTTTVLLFDSARSCHELNTMMKFLSEKVEGFKAYVQENSSSFLSKSLSCSCDVSSYAEHMAQGNDCELMVLVKWLLGLGATLNIYGLATLTKHATESFMLALIDTVPDIKAVGRSSALEQTISLGQLNLAAALIEKGGILINFTRIRGSFHMIPETILQRACAEGVPLWFIKFLVKKGADVNAPPAYYDGLTALQYAARAGSMNVVGLLLDCGADINAISGFHWTQPVYSMRAIDVAALHARLDMVHFLIAAGARSGHLGLTGFDGAITLATESRRFAIAALLQKYADSHRGDRLEAERRWLQANPDARMYKGRIEPQGAFNKREDEDSEADYTG